MIMNLIVLSLIQIVSAGELKNNSLENYLIKEYKIYLIGDSMIQADELEYEKTVYGIINDQKKVNLNKAYGFGYSSWNTEEYLKSIKAIDAFNSKYDIFINANEFLPSYLRSRFRAAKNDDLKYETKYIKFFNNLIRISKSSRTYRRFVKAYNSIKEYKKRKELNSFFSANKEFSCKDLDEYKNVFSNIMFDYITYSLPFECWDKDHNDSYELVLDDLKKMIIEAKKETQK